MKIGKGKCALLLVFVASIVLAGQSENASAPGTDRVGLPKDYPEKFTVLRAVNKESEQKVVTVFGNEPAASVHQAGDLPYPYGSIIVMETARALKDAQGKPQLDDKDGFRRGEVTGIHVMRRERGFGEAYGTSRSGEWEYVEYRPDGSYLTPPQKSFTCAECHLKAGPQRDFVYRGRLPAAGGK
jgi:hypothetical protein